MSRLKKIADDINDIHQREQNNILQQEINKLYRDLTVDKQDAEDALGLEISDDLIANLQDQFHYVLKRVFKTIENLQNNNVAIKYQQALKDLLDTIDVQEDIKKYNNPAKYVIDIINKIINIGNLYSKKEGNYNMKKLRKLANEVTYIATAPIRFTVSPTQYGEPYDDNEIGPSFFSQLKDAVSSSMSEMGPTGLAQYIDSKYNKLEEGLINSIIVDVELQGNKVISKTIIKASRELTDEEIESLKDYISGQFSDGWGEGFEQQAIGDWDEEEETEEWDEEEQENYTDSYTETYELFTHFWSSKDSWDINIKRR